MPMTPLAQSAPGTLSVQTQNAWQWVFVAVPVLLGAAALGSLLVRSRAAAPREQLMTRVAVGMEQPVGLPAWTLAGAGTALWGLVVAFVGFVWDVVWHADTGRDKELFTVPHTLIILGLGAIFVASLLAITLASVRQAPVGLRRGRLRVPWSSIPLLLLGGAAVAGFPLDDFWHATYGIDVTMWSPTHLLMIGGASLTPLAVWLMLAEGGARSHRWGRRLWITMAGLTLVGLSTFQLEYDLGIPQWPILFQPLLIAAAAGFALVAARVAIGRGGAVFAVLVFYASRAPLALMLSAGLGHSLPRFPLYLGAALCVEAICLLRLPMSAARIALLGGGLIGTLGLATEWGWTHLWYQYPWQAELLRSWWLCLVAAVAASFLGVAAGRVFAGQPPRVRSSAVVLALAVLGAALALHLPMRSVDGASATIATAPSGGSPVIDSQGLVVQRFTLRVSVQPPDAAQSADRFDVVAWQGHAPVEHVELRQVGPGSYVGEGTVPVGGTWKSLLILARGDVMDAAPIAMPADAQVHLPPIHAPASRTARFVPAEQLLMREVHGAAEWPFVVILSLFALAVIAWAASLALACRGVARMHRAGGETPLLGRRVARVAVPEAARSR
jgi:hypothetical protein